MGEAKRANKPAGGIWGKTAASQQRRQEILRAAKSVFFADGYQLASMDRLAAVAGTTKRTLYDHYGSKEALFAATIEFSCELFVNKLPQSEDLSADTVEAVSFFVETMASLVNAPEAVRFQRTVIAEAERHPAFAQILNDAAFVAADRLLQQYLDLQVSRGVLKPHDTAVWAQALVGLATNLDHMQMLLGAPDNQARHGATARKQIIAMYGQAYSLSVKPPSLRGTGAKSRSQSTR
ncbi:TetR/AcrR family transcriptional regulator [Bradyrhizobium sp. 156]|uniref:TetR/AcrR family transcriptional regulator n=1 Tax=Bradyrhizobium sp. 156 TaxID=2782630 RepID=UPI001FF85767|nr:TetR/AcrR family transcriptional regulator [Bradyrhizobium sp. 156]MCK1323580.1 TetR/AcrR family transcriptional regulator [Bradyrhizobium sp. 156]